MNRFPRLARQAACFAFIAALSAQEGPDSVLRGTKEFEKKVLVSGLAGPWEVTFGPDNMLWVTERTGKRVTRINPATGERSVAITIEEVSAPGGQDGLLGMALHPELLKGTGNDYVYVDCFREPVPVLGNVSEFGIGACVVDPWRGGRGVIA